MTAYEMHVWNSANSSTRADKVVTFEAVDDHAAVVHMDEFAAALPSSTGVWLWRTPAVAGKSIGSTSGSR